LIGEYDLAFALGEYTEMHVGVWSSKPSEALPVRHSAVCVTAGDDAANAARPIEVALASSAPTTAGELGRLMGAKAPASIGVSISSRSRGREDDPSASPPQIDDQEAFSGGGRQYRVREVADG
ncbi:hypothetical protein THAOC_34018, partial [Thalassiosira oceanica]